MRYLELNRTAKTAAVIRTNADGFVTHEVVLGPCADTEQALEYATLCGWLSSGEWISSGDFTCIDLEPIPQWVAFVGSTVPDNAVELARGAGVMAVDVLKTENASSEGKVRVLFSVEVPKNWEWAESPDWAAFSGEEPVIEHL